MLKELHSKPLRLRLIRNPDLILRITQTILTLPHVDQADVDEVKYGGVPTSEPPFRSVIH